MLLSLLTLLFALGLVFVAAQVFTNALEHMGERLGVSEGVTGSIFAAVGTAMPETVIPIIAILIGGSSEAVNHAVGMGAILGAPFMLATLSLGLMAIAAGHKRGWEKRLRPERGGLRRDLGVFMAGFALVLVTGLLPEPLQPLRIIVAMALFLLYFMYLLRTIRASRALVEDGHATEAEHDLHLSHLFGDAHWVTATQLAIGLGLLIWGARLFTHGAEELSLWLGVPVLVVSLLVIPVATELPEKVNSIMWIRRGKDTMAFGNITGAMAFQGTVIPAAAMLLIPWHIDPLSFSGLSVLLAFAGAGLLWFLKRSGRLTPRNLVGGIAFYVLFFLFVVVDALAA